MDFTLSLDCHRFGRGFVLPWEYSLPSGSPQVGRYLNTRTCESIHLRLIEFSGETGSHSDRVLSSCGVTKVVDLHHFPRRSAVSVRSGTPCAIRAGGAAVACGRTGPHVRSAPALVGRPCRPGSREADLWRRALRAAMVAYGQGGRSSRLSPSRRLDAAPQLQTGIRPDSTGAFLTALARA